MSVNMAKPGEHLEPTFDLMESTHRGCMYILEKKRLLTLSFYSLTAAFTLACRPQGQLQCCTRGSIKG